MTARAKRLACVAVALAGAGWLLNGGGWEGAFAIVAFFATLLGVEQLLNPATKRPAEAEEKNGLAAAKTPLANKVVQPGAGRGESLVVSPENPSGYIREVPQAVKARPRE